jgi:tetratricopeptide (TPR) repeat protein
MSVSASRRTWEEASSPAAVRLAREYEQAWRDSKHRSRRPDPQSFLDSAGPSIDGAGARLALLRADLALRWEAGEKVGARWYLGRHLDLSEDTIVALIYEEFCLREDDGDPPDPAEFLARFPEVEPALRRVLEIHRLVGSGSTQAGLLLTGTGSGEHACAFPEVGQTISGFFLVEELGRGAFARVFLARERELADRPVALKVTRRGSREPQTLARLQHTHIVPVHSHRIDKATGLHLLCMPFFGRTTLARVLADVRTLGYRAGAGLVESLDRLEPAEGTVGASSGWAALEGRTYDRALAWWGARLAEALEHAHDRGVLHRDIKPSNVLVTSDGMPMLLDFNLAREPLAEAVEEPTAPGGTVDYMAPEHLRAVAEGVTEGIDHRSDIYSLGVVLYEALTGRRPFESPRRGSSLVDALQRAADERRAARPDPRSIEPEVPPAMAAVVGRCLEPEPGDRYRSAGELAADLRAVADDLPLTHAREPMASRVGGWLRRKRRKLAIAAALGLALLVVTGMLLGAWLGRMIIANENANVLRTKFDKALDALEKEHKYDKAEALFDEYIKLAAHFDKLDPLNYPSQDRGFTGSLRAIADRLHRLQTPPDLDVLKAQARDKRALAERHASVRADAQHLNRAAEHLRFRLLLDEEDLPTLSLEVRKALERFFVLEPRVWTDVPYVFGMLGPEEQAPLRDEVNELLFLWVAAIERTLSAAGREPTDRPGREKERLTVASALDICDRALGFAEPRAPWLALRARIGRHRGGEVDRNRAADGLHFEGEPRDIESERSALAAFQWGLLDLWAGQRVRSIDWMRRAVRLQHHNYWYHYFLAYVANQDGRPDEALEHYGNAVVLQPESPWARFSRARLYRPKGKWTDALDDLEVAARGLRDRPEGRRVLIERGVLYQMMGDFDRALKEYDEVIRTNARDEYGRAARLNRANLAADSGMFARALGEYDALLAEDIHDADAQHSRAILELRMGRPSLADHDLSALLQMTSPDSSKRAEYLAERGQARLLLGRANEAASDASEARQILPCPAHDRLEQRAFLAARRYDRLMLDSPEGVALLPVRGARLDADLRAACVDLARIAAGHDAAAFRAGQTRAVILAALGDTERALAAANRVAAAARWATTAQLVRARVLRSAGRRGEAAAVVEASLAITLDDPELLGLRGSLRLADGDPRAALQDYDRALYRSHRVEFHLGKAAALLAVGEHQSALAECSWALRRDPELPEAYLGRARIYLLLGQWDLGLGDLEQAAAWGHGDPRIEAAVAISYLQCLPMRPKRLPRLIVHFHRAVADFWRSLDGSDRLAANPERR